MKNFYLLGLKTGCRVCETAGCCVVSLREQQMFLLLMNMDKCAFVFFVCVTSVKKWTLLNSVSLIVLLYLPEYLNHLCFVLLNRKNNYFPVKTVQICNCMFCRLICLLAKYQIYHWYTFLLTFIYNPFRFNLTTVRANSVFDASSLNWFIYYFTTFTFFTQQ